MMAWPPALQAHGRHWLTTTAASGRGGAGSRAPQPDRAAGAGVGTIPSPHTASSSSGFSPAASSRGRASSRISVLAGLGWFFFVRPLARRWRSAGSRSTSRSTSPRCMSCCSARSNAGSAGRDPEKTGESAAMLERLIESAIREVPGNRRGTRPRAARPLALGRRDERHRDRGGAIFTIGLLISAGRARVLVPVSGARPRSPTASTVQPGTPPFARGADVTVTATLSGSPPPRSTSSREPATARHSERAAMITSGEDGGSRRSSSVCAVARLFRQAAGVRSSVFRIEAAELPFVDRLELEYVFPASRLDRADRGRRRHRGAARHYDRLRVHSTLARAAGASSGERDQGPLAVNEDARSAAASRCARTARTGSIWRARQATS